MKQIFVNYTTHLALSNDTPHDDSLWNLIYQPLPPLRVEIPYNIVKLITANYTTHLAISNDAPLDHSLRISNFNPYSYYPH